MPLNIIAAVLFYQSSNAEAPAVVVMATLHKNRGDEAGVEEGVGAGVAVEMRQVSISLPVGFSAIFFDIATVFVVSAITFNGLHLWGMLLLQSTQSIGKTWFHGAIYCENDSLLLL